MNLNIEKTQVIENARVLQGLLERAHEAGFGRWVSHAENQVFQDETEWIPDILSFTYRGTQFFARVEETEVVVEHADENRQHPEVGRVVFSSQEPLDIVNVVLRIQALLNPLSPWTSVSQKRGIPSGSGTTKGRIRSRSAPSIPIHSTFLHSTESAAVRFSRAVRLRPTSRCAARPATCVSSFRTQS